MTDPTQLQRFRVTVRSYNFVTGEVTAPVSTTEDNLREMLLGMVERGEVEWDTDVAETFVVPLFTEVTDEPDPNFPPGVDSDPGAEE